MPGAGGIVAVVVGCTIRCWSVYYIQQSAKIHNKCTHLIELQKVMGFLTLLKHLSAEFNFCWKNCLLQGVTFTKHSHSWCGLIVRLLLCIQYYEIPKMVRNRPSFLHLRIKLRSLIGNEYLWPLKSVYLNIVGTANQNIAVHYWLKF